MPLDQDPSRLVEPKGRKAPGGGPHGVDETRMPLGDHLEELRRRLIRALIALAVAAGGMLYFGKDLVALVLAPLGRVQRQFGLAEGAYALGVPTGFAVYLKVSLLAGLILASPLIVWQVWRFIASGLYHHEKRFVVVLAPLSGLMSLAAAGFSYFLMLPLCLTFLLYFTISFPPMDTAPATEPSWVDRLAALTTGDRFPNPGEAPAADDPAAGRPPLQLPMLRDNPVSPASGDAWIKLPENELRVLIGDTVYRFTALQGGSAVQPMIDVNQYISFAVLLTTGVLIAFQLPVVMLLLGSTGLVRAQDVRRFRKYALFGAFFLGALFTPADPVSMVVLAVPLYLLFEVGLILMAWASPRPPLDL